MNQQINQASSILELIIKQVKLKHNNMFVNKLRVWDSILVHIIFCVLYVYTYKNEFI